MCPQVDEKWGDDCMESETNLRGEVKCSHCCCDGQAACYKPGLGPSLQPCHHSGVSFHLCMTDFLLVFLSLSFCPACKGCKYFRGQPDWLVC